MASPEQFVYLEKNPDAVRCLLNERIQGQAWGCGAWTPPLTSSTNSGQSSVSLHFLSYEKGIVVSVIAL